MTGEKTLFEFGPHWWYLLLAAAWWLCWLVASTAVVIIDLPGPVCWAVFAITGAVCAAKAVPKLITWHCTQYVVTESRIRVRSGLWARTGRDIALDRVQDIAFSQNVLERLVGVGDVQIQSASEDGSTVLVDIARPERFKDAIFALRRAGGSV